MSKPLNVTECQFNQICNMHLPVKFGIPGTSTDLNVYCEISNQNCVLQAPSEDQNYKIMQPMFFTTALTAVLDTH